MSLTDLSRVTLTLTELLRQVVARDTSVATIEFTAAPPDDTSGSMPNIISVHLFHTMEDPHGKNYLPPGGQGGAVPVQQTPLALCLYYVVTATSSVTEGGPSNRAAIEQRLLGFVARAFHDYPIITDSTVVPNVPPAPVNQPLLETVGLQGSDNVIKIVLRPVSVDDTINFWSAEQDRIARISLYYEVRVILFATPRVERAAPPVLSVAEFVSVSDRVAILRTRALTGFALPTGHPLADPTQPFRFFEASPARPALFPAGAAPPSVPPQNNRITFEGAGFQGDRVSLSLEGPMGVGNADPETRRARISISQSVNPEWEITADGVRISIGLRTTVTDEDGQTLTLYPGLYTARIIVGAQMANQSPVRFLETSSADCPFPVAPQIVTVDALAGPAAARPFRITLHGSYLRDALDVVLTVSGQRMIRDADLTVAGHFDFSNATPDRIDLTVDTTAFASPLAIQLVINGAEAAPAWGEF
ncbi:DUF4255 domain-containing protein [Tateyamaria armeniaca]|uniref:DUF4255 domain-containing protein n=1 Tax=Tateyamaria armeniaca TaxID=2518930 RepID=A0ABW8UWT0_9RHOB